MVDPYSQETYQEVYTEKPETYGRAAHSSCPGVRLIPQYKDWLIPPVHDLGGGTGDTARELRQMGYDATSYDWIELDPESMVADITEPLPIDRGTGICVDVFEHIPDEPLEGLMDNLARCRRQVISIANFAYNHQKFGDLHVNRKPFEAWRKILSQRFKIEKEIMIHGAQFLYLCSTR